MKHFILTFLFCLLGFTLFAQSLGKTTVVVEQLDNQPEFSFTMPAGKNVQAIVVQQTVTPKDVPDWSWATKDTILKNGTLLVNFYDADNGIPKSLDLEALEDHFPPTHFVLLQMKHRGERTIHYPAGVTIAQLNILKIDMDTAGNTRLNGWFYTAVNKLSP